MNAFKTMHISGAYVRITYVHDMGIPIGTYVGTYVVSGSTFYPWMVEG